MKFFPVLVLLFSAFFAEPAAAVWVGGQNYVPLTDWAHGDGMNIVIKPGGEIIVTNRLARLTCLLNSAQARINGVNVRLSFPLAVMKGVPLVAQLDLDKTIRPLMFPARYTGPGKIMTICLDPGHGGKDTGNRLGGFFSHNEKTYTLALALELRDQLKKAGFNVVLTRSKDVFVDLPMRPAIANRAGADLFVSLHFNAIGAGKTEVKGPETYCITPVGAASSNAQGEGSGSAATLANRSESKSLLLAYQMEKSLVQNLNAEDRGVRRARFAVLRDAAMPAILVEGGYMTHPTEGKKIFDSSYRRQMAAAIVKGILNYQRLGTPLPAQPATLKPGRTGVLPTNKTSDLKK